MGEICLFAGTAEGRELAEFLSARGVGVTACVATEYGETLLSPGDCLRVCAGRLTEPEMEAFLAREKFSLVVDATHPYAQAVTENIYAACRETGTEYLRLLRETGPDAPGELCFQNIPQAVEMLQKTEGPILLTTGSKDLQAWSALPGFADRVFARVLPMEDSLELCRKAGLPPAHILAMQGPFGEDMNLAMLRAVSARYLVTKASGSRGGFPEKAAAARKAGVRLVVIGRPPQREGLSFGELTQMLCRRFSLTPAPHVAVIGIGPGGRGAMTEDARRAAEQADCLIGAGRMLEAAGRPGAEKVCAIAPEAIVEAVKSRPQYSRFAVLMSGDVGFFSGTKKLLPLLEGCHTRLYPGISSLVCLCARLGTSYEDVYPMSLHGRKRNPVADVQRHKRVFALVGGENGMGELCRRLAEAGLEQVQISVGENLGYPNEKITRGTARELAQQRFDSLSVCLIENPRAGISPGIPDEAFLRGAGQGGAPVPMTKSEVRAVCLSKLRAGEGDLCWDIGAGTGSVSIEMALRGAEVFAVERKAEALALLRENCARFGTEAVHIAEGTAPEACRELPPPSHAFIGGSAGNLREIIRLLLDKNPRVRIVATAIALETVGELTACMKEFPFTQTEVVSLTVARDRQAGPYHLMTGQNPIYIFTMQAGGEGE